MTKEALTLALEVLERLDGWLALRYGSGLTPQEKQTVTAIKEALAQPEQEKERCVGCEACIDTACGRDECPKGWPKAAQPEQEPVAWKLVPIKPTREMLRAMDECSTEGYDERLYAGHAASVYMAAVDVAPNPPEARNQEPVAWRYKPAREDNPRWEYTTNHPLDMGDGYIRPSLVEYCKCIEPLYAKEKPKLMLEKFREMEDLLEEPAQQEPATKEKIREAIVFNLPLYTTPPQRKPLTDEEIGAILEGVNAYGTRLYTFARAIEAKLKEKNT